MYQRSSLQGQDKPKRPKRAVIPSRTAFISKSREKSREKEEVKKGEEVVKIPSYLNLLVNLFYFPLAFIYKVFYKVYSVVSFIISLPSRISQGFQYLATLPWVLVDKASRFPTLLIEWTCRNLEGLLQLCIDYQVGGILCFAVLFWLWPLPDMTYPLFAILRLVLGTLYPAYASFKAVRTKNVREYVKWMMYWIVFAIFSSLETFADIFVAFWFPFYYEVKILLLIWLISPVSKGSLGSSIIYRRFVHPNLIVREDEIDRMICRLQEQGYNTVTKLAVKGFNYISNMVMQTAIRGGGGLVHQLRKSYSLTDLGHDESDSISDANQRISAITSEPDEMIELEHKRRTGSASRGPVKYVRHISHEPEQLPRRRRRSRENSPSPTTERYRETTVPRERRPKGQESYPRSSRPRPKSLFMETTDVGQLKKYRSVVTLKSENSNNYQQRYVPSRSSPTKATMAFISPTHERVIQRRRLSSQDEFLPLMTSEYYSVTHSSDSDNEA